MSVLTAVMEQKAALAVQALAGNPPYRAAAEAEVDAFFHRHPGLSRDRLTEAFITGLVIEGIAAAPQPATQAA